MGLSGAGRRETGKCPTPGCDMAHLKGREFLGPRAVTERTDKRQGVSDSPKRIRWSFDVLYGFGGRGGYSEF